MTSLVTLDGPPPWGFRLSGGKEFRRPLTISKVNVSSSAEQANLRPGDVILEINGEKATGMLHMEAHDSIKYCCHQPTLLINRPKPILSRARPVKSENQSCQERPCKKQVALKTLSKVLEARAMRTGTSKEYHYPNIIASEKLLPSSFSSVGKTNEPVFLNSNSYDVPKKKYPLPKFDVCQKIPWSRDMTTAPRQSNTFRVLQEALEAGHTKSALGARERLQPSPKRQFNTLFREQRFRTCETCGTPIVTQAVRIREGRVRHQECYCCNDCGLSLLMRGHFWVGEELFCGKHARQRYQKTGCDKH